MQNVEKIKNIIFDLGGVILNIDYQLTVTAFKEIGFDGFENAYSQAAQHQLFDKLETGIISPQEFRDGIRKVAQKDLSDAEIDYAWNKIILDLPAARIALLNQLKTRYRCFLLSNTNKIHYDVYTADLLKLASQDFNEIFVFILKNTTSLEQKIFYLKVLQFLIKILNILFFIFLV